MDLTLATLDNKYVSAVIGILLALYGSQLRMKLPNFMEDLFKNNIFRVVFLSSMIVYKTDNEPYVAFTVALIFLITMYYLNQRDIVEKIAYVDAYIESKKT